jgi:hypothetical protein
MRHVVKCRSASDQEDESRCLSARSLDSLVGEGSAIYCRSASEQQLPLPATGGTQNIQLRANCGSFGIRELPRIAGSSRARPAARPILAGPGFDILLDQADRIFIRNHAFTRMHGSAADRAKMWRRTGALRGASVQPSQNP